MKQLDRGTQNDGPIGSHVTSGGRPAECHETRTYPLSSPRDQVDDGVEGRCGEAGGRPVVRFGLETAREVTIDARADII